MFKIGDKVIVKVVRDNDGNDISKPGGFWIVPFNAIIINKANWMSFDWITKPLSKTHNDDIHPYVLEKDIELLTEEETNYQTSIQSKYKY